MWGHYDLCCGVTSSILADYDELVNATTLSGETKLYRLLRPICQHYELFSVRAW
jgi:hypothetical protein